MFERLSKLRAELVRITPRYEEITAKYEDLKAKIHEEEVTEVIGIVDKIGMTPEQLAEYLGVKEEKKAASSVSKKKSQTEKTDKTNGGNESKDNVIDRLSTDEVADDRNAANTEMEDILNESY